MKNIRRLIVWVIPFLPALVGMACRKPPPQPDRATAESLTKMPALSRWRMGTRHPVVLYLDRSGSMRGFLDPSFSAISDANFSSVLDALVVGLSPEKAYGYGARLTPVNVSLAAISNPDFYTESDTRMEEAIARVESDDSIRSSHIVIGDGRRGSPLSALAQYDRLRTAAERWISHGGTFVVAASKAPFVPMTKDPAGCRAVASSEAQTCPLYAFAFVAPGEEVRLVSTLAAHFQNLFVWPMPAAQASDLSISADSADTNFSFNSRWGTAVDSGSITRVLGRSSNLAGPVPAHVMIETNNPLGRIASAAMHGNGVRLQVYSRSLQGTDEWARAQGQGSLLSAVGDSSLSLRVVTHGADAKPMLYRIDLIPDPTPTWLSAYDAVNASGTVRTFGLGKLFEPFKLQSQPPSAVGRLFVVAN